MPAIAGGQSGGRALADAPVGATRPRRAAIIGGLLVLSALLGSGSGEPARADTADAAVTLRIANDGAEALRCVVLLGHWVTRELGVVEPGVSHALAMRRDARDGSLYVFRDDGRKLMIENVVCGADRAWMETLGQIPLLPVRAGRELEFPISCRIDGRLDCTLPRAD